MEGRILVKSMEWRLKRIEERLCGTKRKNHIVEEKTSCLKMLDARWYDWEGRSRRVVLREVKALQLHIFFTLSLIHLGASSDTNSM